MPHTLELFGFTISMYWFFAVTGTILAAALALFRRRAARFHTPAEDVLYVFLSCVAGAFFGAKALQLIGYMIRDGASPDFWTVRNWISMIPGVGVFYGGFFGGLAAASFYIRKFKIDFRDISGILMPSVLLVTAFGRIGCFFAGCCYGRAATWAIAVNGLVPVQLFEAGFNLLALAALLILRPERKRPGLLLPLYLAVYAAGRFVLEFFRGDMGRGVFLLSTSQWISLVIFPAATALLLRVMKNQSPSGDSFSVLQEKD